MAAKKLIKKPVKRVRRFQEGGETADKAAGLEISNRDKPMGFFERLRMGNIDQEGSEAYNRLGAGRAKADRDAASERASSRMVDDMRSNQANQNYNESTLRDDDEMGAAMRQRMQESDGELLGRVNAQGVGLQPNVTRKPSAAVTNSSSPRQSVKTMSVSEAQKQLNLGTKPSVADVAKANAQLGIGTSNRNENYGNEGRSISKKQDLADQIPRETNGKSVTGEKVESMTDTERNLRNIAAAAGVGGSVAGAAFKLKKMYDARKAAAQGAKKRANLKRDVEEGIDRNLVDELKSYSATASEKAIAAKQRADKTLNPLAHLAGPKGMQDNFKRGGKVKTNIAAKKMSSGGAAKSSMSMASKRADGIAQRGKTRGKVC